MNAIRYRFCTLRSLGCIVLCLGILSFNASAQTQTPAPASAPAAPAAKAATAPQAPAAAVTSGAATLPGNINLEIWYMQHSFQLCCILTSIQGIVGPGSNGGPPLILVTVNDGGWAFNIQVLPKYNNVPSYQKGSPVWANMWTRQASFDGVTPCCTITSGVALDYTETVYLDIIPLGVIYAPPGDPNATGSSAPVQTFTYTNSNQTSSTSITASITGGTTSFNATFAGSGVTQTSGTTTTQQSQLSEQSTHTFGSIQKASPPAGFVGNPSEFDIIWFYVNPTFDVKYVGAYNYGPKAPVAIPVAPVYVSTAIHTPVQGDPGFYPPVQWNKCEVYVQEL